MNVLERYEKKDIKFQLTEDKKGFDIAGKINEKTSLKINKDSGKILNELLLKDGQNDFFNMLKKKAGLEI